MMQHHLMHYNGIAYGDAHEGDMIVPVEPSQLDVAQETAIALADDFAAGAEEAAVMFSDAVEESRKHDEHRKFVIAGSALAAYVGLTNTKHKGLGLLSAGFAAYVGMKNYQEMQEAKAMESSDLAGYGAAHRKRCVRKKAGRRCPRGYRARYRADGRIACCRR